MNDKLRSILMNIDQEIIESQSTDLVESGIIDSLKIMQIIAEVERVFNIDFDPEDILPENFSSVQAISRTIERYLNQN